MSTTLVTGHRRAGHQRRRRSATGTPARAAARRRARRRRTAGSPGSGRPRSAPAADDGVDVGGRAVDPRLRRLPRPPGLRRRPRRRSSRPGWPATPYAAGGIRTTVAATRAATDDAAAPPTSPALVARDARARAPPPSRSRAATGSPSRDEARGLRIAARVHRRDHVPRRARRAARSTPTDRDGVRRPGHRPDAATPARRTPAGSTCSASRSAHAFDADQARAILAAGRRRRARRCGCTPTSSAPGPASGSPCELGAGQRRPLHLPDRRRRRRAGAAAGTTSRPCCPGVEFSTRSPYPDARRLLDAGVTVALATDCNPGSCYTSSMPFASRSPSGRWG